jgi:hypothetical protein
MLTEVVASITEKIQSALYAESYLCDSAIGSQIASTLSPASRDDVRVCARSMRARMRVRVCGT